MVRAIHTCRQSESTMNIMPSQFNLLPISNPETIASQSNASDQSLNAGAIKIQPLLPEPRDFKPTAKNSREFRNALGCFATGVTLVTVADEGVPLGITVNSFASVSLDPALVLWSPAKSSARFTRFESAQHYAIHVLSRTQAELATEFAKNAQSFDHCNWHWSEHNVPLIDNCVARFECERVVSHDGGDHAIVVGQVLRAANFGGDPLVFVGGQFGRFVEANPQV